MAPKLSDKMPATQPSTMEARMDAKMDSDAPPYKGEGGSDDAPVMPVNNSQTNPGVMWESINDDKPGWDIGAYEQKGPSWELTDRKDENDENPMPQRDPDGDGDLN